MLLLAMLACRNDQDINLRREPPEVGIVAPADGAVLRQGEDTLVATGLVSDLPDASETLAIAWTLDGDVVDNTPADADGNVAHDIGILDVAPGDHDLALSATDSDGNTTTKHVSFAILAAASPPSVEITAPDDGSTFDLGTSITFTGTATDANDPPDSLLFQWTSSIDGVISGATSGGGLSFVSTDALSEGEHVVVLTVTDTEGDVGTDAVTVTVGQPDPGEGGDPEPGDVVFSELMIDPAAVADEVGEWVELYNTSGSWLDIGGYSFHDLDTDQFTLLGSIPVAPHGYVVLCANLDPATNGGAHCDAWFDREPSGGLALANSPDEVVLTRPDGVEIDRLVYGDAWTSMAKGGNAIGLDPNAMDGVSNDDLANWCAQTTVMSGGDKGTPGVANDPCP